MSKKQAPIRILYLDDSPADARLIVGVIENASNELPSIVECVSTKEAYLAALTRCDFDLILSDHNMTGYDGDEALRDAKAVCPDVPFIMVTGELGEELAIETLKHGAIDYVLKDRLARLIPSIKRALKEGASEHERRDTAKSLIEAQRIAHIGNWEWNIRTGEIRWSKELYSIYGVDPNSFIPTISSFSQHVHPDDRKFVSETINQVFSMVAPVNFDFRIVSVNGSSHVLHTVAEVKQFDSDGKPLVVVGTNQDITEREQMEEALRESEEKFRALSDASPAAIVVYRGDKHLYVNPAAVSMSGYTSEELLTMDFLDLIHPDYREIVRNWALARAKGEKQLGRYQIKIIMKAGEERWIDVSSTLIRYGGMPAGIVVCVDITEQKRALDALRASVEGLRLMVSRAAEAMMVLDHAGVIEAVSPLGSLILGYDEGELVGMNIEHLLEPLPEPVRSMHLSNLERNAQQAVVTQLRVRKKDGTRPWLTVEVARLSGTPEATMYVVKFGRLGLISP